MGSLDMSKGQNGFSIWFSRWSQADVFQLNFVSGAAQEEGGDGEDADRAGGGEGAAGAEGAERAAQAPQAADRAGEAEAAAAAAAWTGEWWSDEMKHATRQS